MSAPPATPQQQAQRSSSSRSRWCGRACTPAPTEETPAHWGEADLHGEGLVPLAGPGAPWVAEFAPADLAAALGISHDAARQLIADALELAYRLPAALGPGEGRAGPGLAGPTDRPGNH